MKGFVHVGSKKYCFVLDTSINLVYFFKKATDSKPKKTMSISNG